MGDILVSSGYGGNTRKPFVMMEAEALDRPMQLSPAEARDLALNLLQAADAAEGDAFLVEFFRKELGQDDKVAASILHQYREFRKKLDEP